MVYGKHSRCSELGHEESEEQRYVKDSNENSCNSLPPKAPKFLLKFSHLLLGQIFKCWFAGLQTKEHIGKGYIGKATLGVVDKTFKIFNEALPTLPGFKNVVQLYGGPLCSLGISKVHRSTKGF